MPWRKLGWRSNFAVVEPVSDPEEIAATSDRDKNPGPICWAFGTAALEKEKAASQALHFGKPQQPLGAHVVEDCWASICQQALDPNLLLNTYIPTITPVAESLGVLLDLTG